MSSPSADGVAQRQRRRTDKIGEDGVIGGSESVVLIHAAALEVEICRSYDERKIGLGGDGGHCDVMRGESSGLWGERRAAGGRRPAGVKRIFSTKN